MLKATARNNLESSSVVSCGESVANIITKKETCCNTESDRQRCDVWWINGVPNTNVVSASKVAESYSDPKKKCRT